MIKLCWNSFSEFDDTSPDKELAIGVIKNCINVKTVFILIVNNYY